MGVKKTWVFFSTFGCNSNPHGIHSEYSVRAKETGLHVLFLRSIIPGQISISQCTQVFYTLLGTSRNSTGKDSQPVKPELCFPALQRNSTTNTVPNPGGKSMDEARKPAPLCTHLLLPCLRETPPIPDRDRTVRHNRGSYMNLRRRRRRHSAAMLYGK